MDQFMGINAFIDDPIDKLKAVGFVREYHNWEWNDSGKDYVGYPKNHIKWDHNHWKFDDFYRELRDSGIVVSPCIQGNVDWLHPSPSKFSDKPLDTETAPADHPYSYQKKAHFMYQFAARYGSAKVSDHALTLAPGQSRRSGMNLVSYLEDWNEQNKTWEGDQARFAPEEYAAMASADYDGHCGMMTTGSGTFGVKNADRNMKFVMGGLAGLNLQYIKDMKSWFEANRPDKKFAADVINFHYYAWKKQSGWEGGGPPKSPEEAGFKEKLEEITRYRDEHLPGLEVWVSEFGWDTHPGSPLCPPAIGHFDIQEVQAQWLLRTYLALAAAGVDRAQMYMLRDVDPNSNIWYSSCGIVGPKGDWKPKKSWYYVYSMKNILSNMRFAGEVVSTDENILIYKFKNFTSNEGVYVVWAKTASNYVKRNFRLTLDKNTSAAAKINLAFDSITGISSQLKINRGSVSFEVTERPSFIKVNYLD
jgi:hypothetical protein